MWPDEARRHQGQKELDAILDRSPAISETNALFFLDDSSVIQKSNNDKLNKSWDRAADVDHNDQDLLDLWYKRKLETSDYKTAQKVNIVLRLEEFDYILYL